MRATLMYKSGDVRVEEVPDPTIQEPTDALVRVTHACVCGSDLHPYHDLEAAIPQVLDGTIDPGRVFDREHPSATSPRPTV